MSDALCGPSNALQQFKQQTSLDRTLQQDRLSTRQPPSQGFRSRDPLAGHLDADFEAFQAGLPLPELPPFQHAPPPNAPAGPSYAPSWATDFQRMQIAPSPNVQQHVPVSPAWAQGFRDHITQTTPRAQATAHSPQAFQHMARYGMNGFQNNYQPAFAPTALSKGKEPAVEEFDEAAFERAFSQASLDLMEETETSIETSEAQEPAYETGASTANYPGDLQTYTLEPVPLERLDQQIAQNSDARALEDATRAGELDKLQDAPVIEQDMNTLEQEEQTQSDSQADDDALAATARELLEKVQHNQTDKFKNSQFLNLMRKLRDREMRVEGDQMVETAAATSTATIDSQGLDTSAAKHIPTFDNSEQTPSPLGPINSTLVDTQPPEYATSIPQHEQDHDAGRINPLDGQDVVDHLNRRWADPDDIGSSMFGPRRLTPRSGKTGWATPSYSSGYYYPRDMEPDVPIGREYWA